MAEARHIYIIAGEASGDLLGAHLMRSLKQHSATPLQFSGIGGPKMQAEGLASLFPYQELSLMGFVEILPYLYTLSKRIRITVDNIMAEQPDAVITIDSPGFCFRVVEKLRERKLRSAFIHYVAPTVWAYKPQRAAKCARLFDHLLVLLPFEPPYFEAVGLPCTWVGHPAIAETQPGDGQHFRQNHAIPAAAPLLCLLPGSRKGEVKRHMPVFMQAMALLKEQFPDLAVTLAVPQNILPLIAPHLRQCPFRAIVVSGEQDKKDAIAAANFAIVKSGTVALEAAHAGTPMIVAYRVHPLSAWIFRRMSTLKYANLVNILQDKEIIPELLQEDCTPPIIASASAYLLSHPLYQRRQQEQAQKALARLLPPHDTPSNIAARMILRLM